ncbi:MAG: type IV toxin-antitoxin system AbiEi family antitoxin [Actinomycetota bacterium]
MAQTIDRPKARELPDWLLAHGRHWITSIEVADLLGIPREHVAQTLQSVRRQGKLFSPVRGAYVPIPPEYRAWGSPPASHFVDPLMRRLSDHYYVGLLSAAEVHGAAHQRPQITQVVADRQVRSREYGRVRILAVYSARAADRETVTLNTPTGTMVVSSPEVTIFDLMSHPDMSGGLSNIATIAGEFVAERAMAADLLRIAANTYSDAVVRRTGWLLDTIAPGASLTTGLIERVKPRSKPVPLYTRGPAAGEHDVRWNVVANVEMDPDL